MPQGRALCVGINEFRHLPVSSWLGGCANDAEDMAALVHDKLGFDRSDIDVRCDSRATKAAVMDTLGALVEAAVDGRLEHLVFTFSSHGTQVPDLDGDEVDRVDEALVAYDIRQSGDAWDPSTVLIDDELRALFDRVPDGVLCEVFLDTCHSGTGLKAMDLLPGRRPKFVPPPTPDGLDGVADGVPVGLVDASQRGGSGARGPVLLAACRSDQTASDAQFGGRPNGAFTYHLVSALRASGDPLPRAELVKTLRSSLRAGRFTQSPQLEANTSARRVPVGQSG